MNDKLTYKIMDILIDNEYTEIIIKDNKTDEKIKITESNIKFKYIHTEDIGYLEIKNNEDKELKFKIYDECIKEIVLDTKSIKLSTKDKSYYFYYKDQMMF